MFFKIPNQVGQIAGGIGQDQMAMVAHQDPGIDL
jgi:hypothetical protein